MSIDKWFFFIGLSLVFLSFFMRKKLKIGYWLSILGILMIFGPRIWPNRLFGNQNAIQDLKSKDVAYVVVLPTFENSKYNLSDSVIIISDKIELDSLVGFLEKSGIFIPNHPMMVWKTELKFFTTDKDSLSLIIEQTGNNGTIINPNGRESRNDEVGRFLEKIIRLQ